MRVLIIGSTGLLGQAMCDEVGARGWTAVTAARSNAERSVDIADLAALDAFLDETAPDLVVNCAALTDILRCETDPGLAYAINARPLAGMAAWSRRTGGRLLHVSTDHFFPTGGPAPHAEADEVELVNEYARSKFAGEAFALTAPEALVLRTSIVGLRGWGAPTFAEWALGAVERNDAVSLFTDAWTSSIDVGTFSKAALDLVVGGARGLLNLAAAEVYSKAAFVQEMARQMDRPLDRATPSAVSTMTPPRPASLGLDVGKAQALLGYPLPKLQEVVSAVLTTHRLRTNP